MNFFDGLTFPTGGMFEKNFGQVRHYPIFYGIQYNHSGKFFLQIDNGTCIHAEGSYAFITHPGAFFAYGSELSESRSHNFVCSIGPRIRKFIDSGLLVIDDENPLIPIRDPELFYRTMQKLVRLIYQNPPQVPPRAVLLFEDLLLQMQENIPADRKIPVFHRTFLSKLKSRIESSPEQTFDFAVEAAKLCVTPTYFRRIFKLYTGLAPHQYLLECRLHKAAIMLTASNNSIAAVGEAVGIRNEFYFSRLFKKKFELSPLEFRKEAYPVS